MRQWRASLARSKPNSSTTANTQIAMARGATCSLISKAITIVRGSTPQSATSPHNRQRQKLHNPVSTFPGEGQSGNIQTDAGAVEKDLAITAYKANDGLEERFKLKAGTEEGVWDFCRTHLKQLPVFTSKDSRAEVIAERQNY